MFNNVNSKLSQISHMENSIHEVREKNVQKKQQTNFRRLQNRLHRSVSHLGTAIRDGLREKLIGSSSDEISVTPFSVIRGIVRQRGRNILNIPSHVGGYANYRRKLTVAKKIKAIESVIDKQAQTIVKNLKENKITQKQAEQLKQQLKDSIHNHPSFKMAKLDERVVNWRDSFWKEFIKFRPFNRRQTPTTLPNINQKIDEIFLSHMRNG